MNALPSGRADTRQFCDEDGNLSRHPHIPFWPATMLSKIEIDAVDETTTRVTGTWPPFGDVKPEELQAFRNMTVGWTGSLRQTGGTAGRELGLIARWTNRLESFIPVRRPSSTR